MQSEPITKTVTEGMAFTFTQEEVALLFQIVGHIGGGAKKGPGATPARELVNDIYTQIREHNSAMVCPNPFDTVAGAVRLISEDR